MNKSPKHHVFMGIAQTLSQLGTCDRKQVGAVIVRDGRCITWGFNGAPPGLPHCDENLHGWLGVNQELEMGKYLIASGQLQIGDSLAVEAVKQFGCRNATHAEANALAFAAK